MNAITVTPELTYNNRGIDLCFKLFHVNPCS